MRRSASTQSFIARSWLTMSLKVAILLCIAFFAVRSANSEEAAHCWKENIGRQESCGDKIIRISPFLGRAAWTGKVLGIYSLNPELRIPWTPAWTSASRRRTSARRSHCTRWDFLNVSKLYSHIFLHQNTLSCIMYASGDRKNVADSRFCVSGKYFISHFYHRRKS